VDSGLQKQILAALLGKRNPKVFPFHNLPLSRAHNEKCSAPGLAWIAHKAAAEQSRPATEPARCHRFARALHCDSPGSVTLPWRTTWGSPGIQWLPAAVSPVACGSVHTRR